MNMRNTTNGGGHSRIETELTVLVGALEQMLREIEERLDKRTKTSADAVPPPEPEHSLR